MQYGHRRHETFQSPATPAIIRSKRSTGRRFSPPSSVRSNLFQSISDCDNLTQICSSPNRTPIQQRESEFEEFDLEAKLTLLSADDATRFGNFVEDFTMAGVVGLGSFSEVCKVDSKRVPGRSFALKRCNKIFQSCRDRENLLGEARILKQLSDLGARFITQFYSAWQENGFLYLLLEYAEYGSVLDIVQKHGARRLRIPDSFLWWMLHDACQGLHALHSTGFVHLDIKPANLLIFGDRALKLSDFGLATKIGVNREEREGDSRYMARELLNDPDRRPSADIFSLGVTLYETANIHTMHPTHELDGIFGRPFSLPTGGDGWHQLRDGLAPRLVDRPVSLSTLVQHMLHPTPELRPSAEHILQIPEVQSGRQVVDSAATTPQSPAPFMNCGALFGIPELLIESVIPRPVINRSSSFEPDMFAD